jgi:hypothetical protein
LTAVSAGAFLGAVAFFAGTGASAGAAVDFDLATGVFFAATGFEGSTAGLTFSFLGAGVEVVFLAAMESD